MWPCLEVIASLIRSHMISEMQLQKAAAEVAPNGNLDEMKAKLSSVNTVCNLDTHCKPTRL